MKHDCVKYPPVGEKCEDCKKEAISNSPSVPGWVAVVSETIQTSEDSWAVRSRTKICNGETTIAEIAEWAGTRTLPSIVSGKVKRKRIMQNVELTEAAQQVI